MFILGLGLGHGLGHGVVPPFVLVFCLLVLVFCLVSPYLSLFSFCLIFLFVSLTLSPSPIYLVSKSAKKRTSAKPSGFVQVLGSGWI